MLELIIFTIAWTLLAMIISGLWNAINIYIAVKRGSRLWPLLIVVAITSILSTVISAIIITEIQGLM